MKRFFVTLIGAAMLLLTALMGPAQAASTYHGPFSSESQCEGWRQEYAQRDYIVGDCFYDTPGWWFQTVP